VIATDDPDGGRENPWLSVNPVYGGRWSLSYISPVDEVTGGLPRYGDGVSFPQMQFWSVGVFFDGVIEFPSARVVSDKKRT
jgi:hypothetical protein